MKATFEMDFMTFSDALSWINVFAESTALNWCMYDENREHVRELHNVLLRALWELSDDDRKAIEEEKAKRKEANK